MLEHGLKSKTSLLLSVFLLLLLSLTSCLSQSSKLKTFIFCSEGAPFSFNPQVAGDGTTFDASSQPLYNRLIDFKQGSTDLKPSLAEKWSFSKTGDAVLFKLRKNIAFHSTKYFKPSRFFNADDVVFSFERMLKAEHPYHKVSGGGYEYFKSTGMDKLIKRVRKVSEHEVAFDLTKPNAAFLANLAMDFASILSKEYADSLTKQKKQNDIDRLPLGTGPFKFIKYKKNKTIEYAAHEDYFLGKSKIEILKFLITPDPVKRLEKLSAKKCHLIKEPPPHLVSEIENMEGLKLVKSTGLNTGYIGFNLEKTKLQNIKLRQAMSLALNRRSYIESVYFGMAKLAKSPVPPSIWSLDDKLTMPEYNLEKARKLMKKSGLETPLDITMWTLPVSRPYNPNGQKMGEMIRADLRQIGIDLKLQTYSWPTYLEKSRNGEHDLIQYGWSSDNGDPDNFLYTLLSCSGAKGKSNVARFCNKKYDKLVTKARFVFSQKKRKALYRKALKIFQREMPWIPIAHSNVYRAMSDEVRGYVPRPLGTESFYQLSLSSWDKN